MNLEQSGSAPMVTMFISNSLVGERVMSARGKPFHHNTDTSKENTGVFFLLFASFFSLHLYFTFSTGHFTLHGFVSHDLV